MKPNEKYDPNEHAVPENSLYSNFQSLFFNLLNDSPKIDETKTKYDFNGFEYQITQEEKDFYSYHYLCFSELIKYESNDNIKKILSSEDFSKYTIGKKELDIIDFLFFIPKQYCVILGDVGWGKSTLIKYMFYYLFPSVNPITKKIFPIYLDFNNLKKWSFNL